MTKSNDEELLATLRKALELRIKGQEERRKRINIYQDAFRALLVSMERENETLKLENSSMKVKTQVLSEEKSKNETVLRQLMQDKDTLQFKLEEQGKLMQEMEQELADLRMQYRQRDVQHFKEKQSLKSDLDLQRELDDLKRKRELHREQENMKAEYKQQEKTLAKVRQIVSSVNITESRASRSRHRSATEQSFSSTSSEPDLTAVGRSRTKSGTRTRAPSVPALPIENGKIPHEGYAQTRRGLGIPNSRRPRTRSTDQDVWIEHITGLATMEGTVMQPCMKKKSLSQN